MKNKEKYTQLAKEGKFDELPDTCEFSEPVELEVWDFESVKDNRMIVGKFKNLFMAVTKIDNEDYRIFKYAQLPTKKIDFSKFRNGDIVEVVTKDYENFYGLLFTQNFGEISLTFSYKSDKAKNFLKTDIISIKKIK